MDYARFGVGKGGSYATTRSATKCSIGDCRREVVNRKRKTVVFLSPHVFLSPKQTFNFIYALIFFLSMHVRALIINFPTDEQAEPEGGSNNLLVANYLESRNPKYATPGVV